MIKGIILAMIALLILGGCSSDEVQRAGDNFQTDGDENWCEEGSILDVADNSEAYKIEVLGIRDSGEYEGMCHYRYIVDSDTDSGVIDYYIDKNGNGYQVMTMNGETTRVAWNAGEQ